MLIAFAIPPCPSDQASVSTEKLTGWCQIGIVVEGQLGPADNILLEAVAQLTPKRAVAGHVDQQPAILVRMPVGILQHFATAHTDLQVHPPTAKIGLDKRSQVRIGLLALQCAGLDFQVEQHTI